MKTKKEYYKFDPDALYVIVNQRYMDARLFSGANLQKTLLTGDVDFSGTVFKSNTDGTKDPEGPIVFFHYNGIFTKSSKYKHFKGSYSEAAEKLFYSPIELAAKRYKTEENQ